MKPTDDLKHISIYIEQSGRARCVVCDELIAKDQPEFLIGWRYVRAAHLGCFSRFIEQASRDAAHIDIERCNNAQQYRLAFARDKSGNITLERPLERP